VRAGVVGGDDPHGAQRQEHADGDVDEEDRLPADELRQSAAEQHADRRAGTADCAPDAECVGACTAAGEARHDDRQRGGRQERCAEALKAARGEQCGCAGGERRGDRGAGEDRQAGEEHASAAQQVGGAAAEQQQAAEDQRVARDRPTDVRAVDAQAVGEIGQRDVDGGDVEDDHQLRDAHHQQQANEARP
jgi:hypothetical protein